MVLWILSHLGCGQLKENKDKASELLKSAYPISILADIGQVNHVTETWQIFILVSTT